VKFFADSREPEGYIQSRIPSSKRRRKCHGLPFSSDPKPHPIWNLSLPAFGFAKSIAKDQGATLHLRHVVAMASALGEPAINATLHSRAEEKAIEALMT
jgi:hypothetical protein